MIAHMDKVTVVGRRGIAKDLLVALQSLGVVQVDPIEPDEALELTPYKLAETDQQAKDSWSSVVSRAESLIDVLDVEGVEPNRSGVSPDLDSITSQLETISRQTDDLVAERAELRDDLDVVSTYLPLLKDLTPILGQFDDSQYLRATAFAVPNDKADEVLSEIRTALDERVEFQTRPRDKDVLVVAATLRKDRDELLAALSRAGLAEISLPERYAGEGVAKASHRMQERSQAIPSRLETIQSELQKVADEHGAKLNAIHQIASNHQARYDASESMATGRYGIALQGWMPSSERSKVVEGIKKQFGEDVVIDTRAADEHHDHNVPVKLENPKWIKPFEGLLALFAPPKYGSFDPSWTLAVFFPLFFGLVVGDIGFALMFAAIAWWMRRRGQNGKELNLGILGIIIKPEALKPISTVIFWCAAWSVFFGILYGEFFGNFLEKWPKNNPIFYTTLHHEAGYGLFNIALFRVEVFTPLLLLSIGFGILQVMGGWVIRVIYGLRHGDMKHVYEGIGMFAGLLALVVFSWAFLTENAGVLTNFITIAGLAVFVICVFLSRIPLMLIELVSNGGAILSYLRLFAVGLSAAIVANLATGLGFALGGTLPIIGPILGILVAAAVHLIAIALTIIGHTLQPLRLHYVEFFTKFGFYDENGRPYKPFRLLGGKA